ncbi:MAG TPA: ABC transporter permease [Flavobacteriales bacterium]|nr:ABC transporter permease [Flavobacteriales bacterium]
MILKIAWRNIWRNKIRSLVVIIAIALGLWAGTFASGFYEGMIGQKINDVIENEYSHFQFHHKKFRDELAIKEVIENGEEIREKLNSEEKVVGSSGRVIATAMIASANKSGGIKAVGVLPSDEAVVTQLNDKIVEGEYFEGIKRNPILISKKIADDYHLDVKNKLVLTLQDVDGEIISASFRVAGIYKSNNGMFDEMNVFVQRSDLQNIVNLQPSEFHEIAVLLTEHSLAEQYAKKYADLYPNLEVLPWLDLAVGMRYMVEASGTFAYIFVGIILVALLFSIVNTMLMAVMERTREIGMLKAVGLNRRKIFSMIMLETVFLSMIGAPLGLLIAYGFIERLGKVGFDLGSVGEAYSEMGFAAVIYPELGFETYLSITIMVFCMAFIAAIYPARKALKLNASEAIRKI